MTKQIEDAALRLSIKLGDWVSVFVGGTLISGRVVASSTFVRNAFVVPPNNDRAKEFMDHFAARFEEAERARDAAQAKLNRDEELTQQEAQDLEPSPFLNLTEAAAFIHGQLVPTNRSGNIRIRLDRVDAWQVGRMDPLPPEG